ncbi:CdaR family transcriptional regulator [Companilactobacillus kimchiensis]|uniref:Sugar diacid utilization regulator n=1 Tax=Companilactobacillus kimchiensis TaxID=993692 RepID=A0A0R2LF95_9LACO|nr:sugar diacid recognition domain-containing protein [Companilactobacillus kimchiensis]KRO00151.1 sugar diacid utilization regulator [Companilactobacillus kimchiensis]
MKLDPHLAQVIVDKMMISIPYNINMMNEKGYIIASGDKKRINTLHIGAIDTIKSGKTKPMIESFGEYGQPGVNIPVEFLGKTIGVIGITGDPEKVTPLAALLKISTELLISQINHNKIENQQKETLNHFLYQWTSLDDAWENEELKLRAQSLSIDLSLKRYAIIIESSEPTKLPLNQHDFSFSRTSEQQLIITKSEINLNNYLHFCQNNNLTIGISNKTNNLKLAVQQAQETINVSQELQMDQAYYYYQVSFLDHLLKSDLYSTKILNIFKSFLKTNSGLELIETLDCYFKHNGNITDTSNALKVHRNTTNYRLNNISEYFNLNLHNLTDLLQLYTNYLYFKKYQYEHH